MTKIPFRILRVAVGLVCGVPLLAVIHETLFLLTAWTLRVLFQADWLQSAVQLVVGDPIHAQIVSDLAGSIEPQGLALGGAPGQFLHAQIPALFIDPVAITTGAWVSSVFTSSSIFSLILTRALVEGALVACAFLLIQWSLRGTGLELVLKQGNARQLTVLTVGALVLGQAITALFDPAFAPSAQSLRDAGIGLALSTVWQVSAAQYNWLMDSFLPLSLPALTVASGLASAWLLSSLLSQLRSRARRAPVQSRGRQPLYWNRVLTAGALGVGIALSALLPDYGGLARTQLAAAQVASFAPEPSPAPASEPTPTPAPEVPADTGSLSAVVTMTPPPLAAPTSVTWKGQSNWLPERDLSRVSRWRYASNAPPQSPAAAVLSPSAALRGSYTTALGQTRPFRILVSGRTQTLIGMNYNVNYTQLPPETRLTLHRRDFRILRAAGVNAVIGWGVYDEVTLQAAQEAGIGVIMPFDLDPQGTYDNASYRQQVRSNFIAFVNRFHTFPAVLAWNPGGDELLHRMAVEQHRTGDKLQAAAEFLVELSAAAHALDPAHVSVVKDARDWYLPYFEQSLARVRSHSDQVDPSSYLVYAVDSYGTPGNIAAGLANARDNVESRLRLAFLVGEYAPLGLARQERPADFGAVWDTVYALCPNGGFAYVFGPDQPNPQAPNPYDPLRLLVNEFSLVDINGMPVDDALRVLAGRWSRVRTTPP